MQFLLVAFFYDVLYYSKNKQLNYIVIISTSYVNMCMVSNNTIKL